MIPEKSAEQLADEFLDYINHHPTTSFAELDNHFREMRGDKELRLNIAGFENVVLWSHMSHVAIEAFRLLLDRKALIVATTSLLVYLVDGAALKYPLVGKRKPKRPYTTPHWCPVVLSASKGTA